MIVETKDEPFLVSFARVNGKLKDDISAILDEKKLSFIQLHWIDVYFKLLLSNLGKHLKAIQQYNNKELSKRTWYMRLYRWMRSNVFLLSFMS